MTSSAWPPPVSRPWLLTAGLVWLVTALFRPAVLPPLEPSRFSGEVVLSSDVFAGQFNDWALGRIGAAAVLIELPDDTDVSRGDRVTVEGRVGGDPGTAAGRGYSAVLEVVEVRNLEKSRFLPHRAGAAVRRAVERTLAPQDEGRALLGGFLVGDTSGVSEADVVAMRRSGLAHFVAVSGSNVALFLGLLAVIAGPLAMGPKRRAIVGLTALPVFVAATRFEPSVVRASVMAGLALVGRLVDLHLEAWQLLSTAVVALVVVDPSLVANAGFQMSVAATAGVLIGSRWPVTGRFQRTLAITLGAQIGVAPLLILHFGTVPLFSPVVNLLAAPLVTLATLLGALAVLGLGLLTDPAAWIAGLVLDLARMASTWPQLEAFGLLGVGVATLVVLRWRGLRPVAAVVAVGMFALVVVGPGRGIPEGSVVVLDVGQGDAILIHGGEGRFALVDGGPDPALLLTKLRSYGVSALELVILTHVHADHATGLAALPGEIAIGEMWSVTEPHVTEASRRVSQAVAAFDIAAFEPRPGTVEHLGALTIEVVGPIRRYASPNDQSLVVKVTGTSREMLLAGDIETHAQADLDHLRADVLKVPHQGAATSDPDWLRAIGASLAVISVGPNQFGHPASWVIETLVEGGAEVLRTDLVGDVVVSLSS